jgi:CAAX prenyl protease-like protein
MNDLLRGPSVPYVMPFGVFMLLLAVQSYIPLPQNAEYALRCAILIAVLWYFSRDVISFRVVNPIGSLALGVAVFLIWIGPDALIPGYRQHWLFQNSITGQASGTIDAAARTDMVALFFRTFRAVILVPIIEELFWRAWALRWVANTEFETMPLGTYTTMSFWVVAGLFAAEHGPYWEVGLICGVLYNWWMGKTRSLGDLILTHAVTNGVLCAYVIATGKWEYWM